MITGPMTTGKQSGGITGPMQGNPQYNPQPQAQAQTQVQQPTAIPKITSGFKVGDLVPMVGNAIMGANQAVTKVESNVASKIVSVTKSALSSIDKLFQPKLIDPTAVSQPKNIQINPDESAQLTPEDSQKANAIVDKVASVVKNLPKNYPSIDFFKGLYGGYKAYPTNAEPVAFTPKNTDQKFGAIVADLVIGMAEGKATGILDLLPGGNQDVIVPALQKSKLTLIPNPLTKTTVEEVTPPKSLTITSSQLRDIHTTGTLTTAEEKDFIAKAFANDPEAYTNAIKGKANVTIDIPASKIVTVADRPYWAKIKELFDLPSTSRQTFTSGDVTRTVFTPDEVATYVVQNDLGKDTTGKQLMLSVAEAQKEGTNISITPTSDMSGIKVELSPKESGSSVVQDLSTKAKNSLENNAIGIKPGGLERATQEISQGIMPPVKIRTLEDGTTVIEDGRHHLEAARQMGVKDYPTEDVTKLYEQPTQPKGVPTETPKVTKPSKIGKDIEAKAVESKITQGFTETAGYTPITIKEQSKIATDLVNNDFETARSIIKGETPLPENLKGTALIKAIEEHLKVNPSESLAYELANSPLVSGTSTAAQEMRLAAERDPNSFTARVNDLVESRKARVKEKEGSVKKATDKVVKSVEKHMSDAAPKADEWMKFIQEIECGGA